MDATRAFSEKSCRKKYVYFLEKLTFFSGDLLNILFSFTRCAIGNTPLWNKPSSSTFVWRKWNSSLVNDYFNSDRRRRHWLLFLHWNFRSSKHCGIHQEEIRLRFQFVSLALWWRLLNIKIFFIDREQNVIKLESGSISVQTGEQVNVPCIATHPNVTISLLRRSETEVKKNIDESNNVAM